jgi:hypothetical protein
MLLFALSPSREKAPLIDLERYRSRKTTVVFLESRERRLSQLMLDGRGHLFVSSHW